MTPCDRWTTQEYFEQRLDDQIGWYDRKSQSSQKWYKRLRLFEIMAAASIPVLIAHASDAEPAWAISVAVIGALIAVTAAVLGLYQFEQIWTEYRTTCESLKKEKYLFLTRSEPYEGDAQESFQLLVQRVETLVSKENTNWAQYMMRPEQRRS